MDPDTGGAFGELLRRYRAAAGLTQAELAARSGLTPQAISLLERGERQRPQTYTVHKLSGVLGLVEADRARFAAAARGRVEQVVARPGPGAALERERTRPPLVGRTRELSLLERHLAGEGPPVLMLAGEPGIGKSRLLQEAAQRGAAAGWRVLVGVCQLQGGQAPYVPLLDALERHIMQQPPRQVRSALQGCAWLVRLLPQLAAGPIEPLPAWTLTAAQERRLLFGAVGRYLANVAGPRGTLLVLDDLQWANADALDLLATLVRSAADVPVRVVGAYRSTEVEPRDPLAVTLVELARADLAGQHTLGPLAPQEARQLLDALLAGAEKEARELRARVLQRAGGVPFFLVSCARALRAGALTGSGDERVPWDVAQSIRQRVAALPDTARTMLGVAAVVGRAVESALLAAVTARPEEEVVDALAVACQGRLLEEEAAGYQFAHDVVREVVEADLGQRRRRVLHRRVAEVLEQGWGPTARGREDPPVELLAYHYTRSDRPDKAVLYLERAGDRAAAQAAHAAAASCYQDLVERLKGLGRSGDTARVQEKLGEVLLAATQYDAALAVLEQAAEIYRAAGDTNGLGRVAAQIGRAHPLRGTPDEGLRYLAPIRAALEASQPSHGLAALYAALPNLYYCKGAYEDKLAAAGRAAHLARAVGDARNLAWAVGEQGSALLDLGRIEQALGVLAEARRLAEAMGDLLILRRVCHWLAQGYKRRADCAAARCWSARALAIAERLGEVAQVAYLTAHRGELAFIVGDWDQARGDCEQAVALSRPLGMSFAVLETLVILGRLCLALGDWDAAASYLEDSLAMAEHGGTFQTARAVYAVLAERDLLCGDPAAAHARLIPIADRARLDEVPLLAWVHLERSNVTRAHELVTQAIAHAQAGNDRLTLMDALRVLAMVAMRQGQPQTAILALEEGLALARDVPYPYAEGRLVHVYASVHAAQGQLQPARERLEAALAIFQRLGARRHVDRVVQARADLQRPRDGA